MKNRDIYTIQRHLFIKKTPTHTPVRLRIRMNEVIDTLSVFGLVLLVGLLLVL